MGARRIRVAHRLALCPEPNGDASNLIQLTPSGQFTGGKLRPRELSWPVENELLLLVSVYPSSFSVGLVMAFKKNPCAKTME